MPHLPRPVASGHIANDAIPAVADQPETVVCLGSAVDASHAPIDAGCGIRASSPAFDTTKAKARKTFNATCHQREPRGAARPPHRAHLWAVGVIIISWRGPGCK